MGLAPHAVLQCTVTDMHQDGDGVADHEGYPLRIAGAVPGDLLSVEVTRIGKHYGQAQLRRIERASTRRVRPFCAEFGHCGGCQLQHVTVDLQQQIKQQALQTSLHQAGVAVEQWLPTPTAPSCHYRRRARLAVRQLPGRGVVIGFRARHQSYVHSLHECPILEPRLSVLLPVLAEAIARTSIAHRIPQVEIVAGDKQVAVVVRHLVMLSASDRQVLIESAKQHGFLLYTQAGGPEQLVTQLADWAAGLNYGLPEFDLKLGFLPTDFIQANVVANQQLVDTVITLAAPETGDTIADAYCGIGNFALPLARSGVRVHAFERSKNLLQRGEDNARSNGLLSIHWYAADLDQPDNITLSALQACNKIVLDPPRAGAIALLKAWRGTTARRIVYVSCDVKSFARDAAYLVHRLGYRLACAGLIDMFAQTRHSESVALFVPSGEQHG